MNGMELKIHKGKCKMCGTNHTEHKVYHGNGGLEAHAHWTINGIRYKVFVNGMEVTA
jgi:hypothetical protein